MMKLKKSMMNKFFELIEASKAILVNNFIQLSSLFTFTFFESLLFVRKNKTKTKIKYWFITMLSIVFLIPLFKFIFYFNFYVFLIILNFYRLILDLTLKFIIVLLFDIVGLSSKNIVVLMLNLIYYLMSMTFIKDIFLMLKNYFLNKVKNNTKKLELRFRIFDFVVNFSNMFLDFFILPQYLKSYKKFYIYSVIFVEWIFVFIFLVIKIFLVIIMLIMILCYDIKYIMKLYYYLKYVSKNVKHYNFRDELDRLRSFMSDEFEDHFKSLSKDTEWDIEKSILNLKIFKFVIFWLSMSLEIVKTILGLIQLIVSIFLMPFVVVMSIPMFLFKLFKDVIKFILWLMKRKW